MSQLLAGVTADQARLLVNLCIYTRHDLYIRRRPDRPGLARLALPRATTPSAAKKLVCQLAAAAVVVVVAAAGKYTAMRCSQREHSMQMDDDRHSIGRRQTRQ